MGCSWSRCKAGRVAASLTCKAVPVTSVAVHCGSVLWEEGIGSFSSSVCACVHTCRSCIQRQSLKCNSVAHVHHTCHLQDSNLIL